LLGGICWPQLSDLEVEVIKEFFQENAVPGKRVEATPSKKGGSFHIERHVKERVMM